MSGTQKRRIIVFDEDKVYNTIVQGYLSKSDRFNLVNSYDDFNLLLERFPKDKADTLLLDPPQTLSFKAIGEIKARSPFTEVVILSSNDEDEYIYGALRAGADGYVMKCLDGEELYYSLNKLQKGGVALSPSVARRIVSQFWITSNNPLTKAEIKILQLTAKGLTYSGIAKSLKISSETVKTHTKNIYRKLDVHKKSRALEKAYQEGLIN